MSKNISNYTNSNYGIGVTGQLKRKDPNNKTDEDNKVYISIYDRDNNKYYNEIVIANKFTRRANKSKVIKKIVKKFSEIL